MRQYWIILWHKKTKVGSFVTFPTLAQQEESGLFLLLPYFGTFRRKWALSSFPYFGTISRKWALSSFSLHLEFLDDIHLRRHCISRLWHDKTKVLPIVSPIFRLSVSKNILRYYHSFSQLWHCEQYCLRCYVIQRLTLIEPWHIVSS